MNEVSDFACSNCKSRYKLVRVRLNPNFPSRLLHCRVCNEPLTPTGGEHALKYFYRRSYEAQVLTLAVFVFAQPKTQSGYSARSAANCSVHQPHLCLLTVANIGGAAP